jgi:arylsulfatase A-like enzyme
MREAAHGEIRSQWHHFIDVVPTLLDASKVTPPVLVDGIQLPPIEGVSLASTAQRLLIGERRNISKC